MRLLLDSNFYSILYYNATIWLTPDLISSSKHDLLAISANALRTLLFIPSKEISFINIHKNSMKHNILIMVKLASYEMFGAQLIILLSGFCSLIGLPD